MHCPTQLASVRSHERIKSPDRDCPLLVSRTLVSVLIQLRHPVQSPSLPSGIFIAARMIFALCFSALQQHVISCFSFSLSCLFVWSFYPLGLPMHVSCVTRMGSIMFYEWFSVGLIIVNSILPNVTCIARYILCTNVIYWHFLNIIKTILDWGPLMVSLIKKNYLSCQAQRILFVLFKNFHFMFNLFFRKIRRELIISLT